MKNRNVTMAFCTDEESITATLAQVRVVAKAHPVASVPEHKDRKMGGTKLTRVWKALPAGLALAFCLPLSLPAQSSGGIFLHVRVVDSEGKQGLRALQYWDDTTAVQFLFPDGVRYSYRTLYDVNTQTPYSNGTYYMFRIREQHMGTAIGYGRVGVYSGAWYTAAIPASKIPGFTAKYSGPTSATALGAVPYVADGPYWEPTILLERDLSQQVVASSPVTLSVEYLPGNLLESRGSDSRFFPPNISHYGFFYAVWKPHLTTSNLAYFGPEQGLGPVKPRIEVQGYAPSTGEVEVRDTIQTEWYTILTPTTGGSASFYLEELGLAHPKPPNWLLRQALEERISGQARYFYPPLDKYADVNGDGVYDAADLVLVSGP